MSRRTRPPLPALLLLLLVAAAATLADSGPPVAATAPANAPAATPDAAPALLSDLPPAPLADDLNEVDFNDFLREGRAPRDNNFVRLGRGPDNFMRFGKAGRDNFMRFGRAPRDNFVRFGKAYRDNFMRFGRAGKDNFMRFGRAGKDNFMRFGRAGKDNFMRFGRAGKDNFMRFGRGDEGNPDSEDDYERDTRSKTSNFMRLGRADGSSPDPENSIDRAAIFESLLQARDAAAAAADAEGAEDNWLPRELRGGKANSFIRFGRARPDNFLRLGRDPREGPEPTAAEPEDATPTGADEDAAAAAADSEEAMDRTGRAAARPRSLFGRWKMSDLNFIRLGRSAPGEEFVPAPAKRAFRTRFGRSDQRRPPRVDNFIRLGNGKRSEEQDETEDEAPRRNKRSADPNCEEGRGQKSLASSIFGDLPLAPFGYYSPLAVGLPNYLFAPEMSPVARPAGEAGNSGGTHPIKRVSGGGNSNFIRLG